MPLLLEHGYNDLGVDTVLRATATPKGSFYHHFADKQDFALQVVDRYMSGVHAGLEECLGAPGLGPLARVRLFFETTRDQYRQEGYLGCLLGTLGQELAASSDVFRRRIDACLDQIAAQLAGCLQEARRQGEIPPDSEPERMARLLVDCWEGAALRSRLRREQAPLDAMLDFCLDAVAGPRGRPVRG
jgi:TetR/AcrR family transcriptional regulator, transcriptional repressor for nem operon